MYQIIAACLVVGVIAGLINGHRINRAEAKRIAALPPEEKEHALREHAFFMQEW